MFLGRIGKPPTGDKRRWYQFSLRTLLLATAAVALLLGVSTNGVRRRQRAVKTLLAAHAKISYGDSSDRSGKTRLATAPSAPEWARQLLGDDYFLSVHSVELSDPTDVELSAIGDLPTIRRLIIHGSKGRINDERLANLKGLKQLERLELEGRGVTDVGMEHLLSLTNLRQLALRETRVTHKGLKKLQRDLPNLKEAFAPGVFEPVPEEAAVVAALRQRGGVSLRASGFRGCSDVLVLRYCSMRSPQFPHAVEIRPQKGRRGASPGHI
jgi:hypothetical protein